MDLGVPGGRGLREVLNPVRHDLDIAFAGYTVARYTWELYPSNVSWDAINRDFPPEQTVRTDYRHYTFAFEPGFDAFVKKRVFAIGARAWMPVVAAPESQSSTDNTTFMVNFTYTPMWREKPRLKPEYDPTISGL